MSEVNKIANYNQMMSWLTRPSTPKTETREKFYAGSSLEQFGSQIKESFLAGKSIPKINEELGFKNDRTSTIDSFIKSMQSGEAPITITEEEFSARPVVKQGRGQAGEAQKRLKTFIETFEKKK